MALTWQRWIAAAIAGCLVALVLAASGDDSTRRQRQRTLAARDVLEARANRSGSAATRASARLRRKLLVDSVNAVLARSPRENSARLLVPASLPKREQFTRAVNARLGGALPLKTAIEVNFVAFQDTSRQWTREWNLHVLPSAASNMCVAISGFPTTRDDNVREWIGPCGFYATFGAPGPNIDRWLRAGSWVYGSRWRTAAAPKLDLTNTYDWYNRALPWRRQAGFPLRRFMGVLAYSCLAGNSSACGAPVLNPRDNDEATDWYGYRAMPTLTHVDGASVWMRSNDYGFFGFLLGPAMRSFLSDMAVSLGPERFRQFWTSSLPPAEAFRAAAGQSIEDWTANWMRTTYGDFGRGPSASTMAVVFALGLAVLALGGASVTWRRRQVA